MPSPNPLPGARIELDLDALGSGVPSPRSRPFHREPPPSLPPLEPVLGDTDVSSDEAERTVGAFMLLTALPSLLSIFAGRGPGGLVGAILPVYLGIGLFRRDDFARQWVRASCAIQLLLVVLLGAMAGARALPLVLGAIAQNAALLVLVSGKALSQRSYRLCLGGVAAGVLLSLAGLWLC